MNVSKLLLAIVWTGFVSSLGIVAADGPQHPSGIFEALRAGDRAKIRTWMKSGAVVRSRDSEGNTPLIVASMNSDVGVVELLLDAGSEVNATNHVGVTALMRAATSEQKVRLLVARGADVHMQSQLGNTALTLAARKAGNSATVKLLLERHADANPRNVFGATPLLSAVAAEDMESVKLLLDHGADVNVRPSMDVDGFIWGGGRTPLMWAAYLGNEPLLQLLLACGAKVNDFTIAGGALEQAAWGGRVGAARILLDAGAQIDQRDLIANYTPLHWAASSERSSPALVELLLARGANVNAEGGQPVDNFLGVLQTPLSLARKRGHTPIVQALLKAGAKDTGSPADRSRKGASAIVAGLGDPKQNIIDAIQRALPLLAKTAEESAATFLKHASKQNCISCHQQQLPSLALSWAKTRHFPTDSAATGHQLELLRLNMSTVPITGRDPRHTAMEMDLQSTFQPEPTIMGGYASLELQLEHEPPSEATDALVHSLATTQNPDGHWSWNLPRPPIQSSDIGATAMATHTLRFWGAPARRAEFDECVRRARLWLSRARPETTEERAHQLLGLAWSGEKVGALKTWSDALMGEQRTDGGWAQLPGLESDAYATGQSLFALMEAARISESHPSIRRGIDFLFRAQGSDGSWHVRRRAHPFQPPMESSFPHGADGWISSAATSWAVMALSRSLSPSTVPKVQPVVAKTQGVKPISASQESGETVGSVEFERDIRPLFERSCVACHSGERPKGGLVVTTREGLLRGGARGEAAIVPGKPEASPLLRLVRDQVEDLEMPPVGRREKFPALTKEQVSKLNRWISQGAQWPSGTSLRSP